MKKNLKIKGNIIIACIIVCAIIAIITTAIMFERRNEDTKVTSTEKVESMLNKEEQSTPKAITEIKAREPNTNNFTYVTSEDEIQVPVPKGYVASTDAEERYVNGVTTDGIREHHGGFVIYEKNTGETDEQATALITENLDTAQKTRNQWVWIPIDENEVNNMYHITNGKVYGNYYNFTSSSYNLITNTSNEPSLTSADDDHTYLKQYLEGISRKEFLQEMRKEFFNMIESVATYGGFYIGRYETGNVNGNNVKIMKGQVNLDNSWYKSYLKIRNLKGKNPVYTGIIWDIQFDETLKWLLDSKEKSYSEVSVNSESWGNYYGTSFTYTKPNGSTASKTATYVLVPTGSTDRNKANNIYDLAGNARECTMAIYVPLNSSNIYRGNRGGMYLARGYNDPASYRKNGSHAYSHDINGQCRASLYIVNN